MGSPAPHFPTASPSPTTCTVLFSLNFSLKHPQITSSITVVFREEAQVEEQCTHLVGLSSEKAQEGSGGVNVEIVPGDPGPFKGWCRIFEEPLDDE